VSGLSQPTSITHAGDGSGRLFVLEQPGRIRIVKDGVLLSTPFLDITERVGSTGREQGLLGLAFSPAYASTGNFYVHYTDLNGDIVIARFSVTAAPDVADPASEVLVLGVPHPSFSNHNGGQLAFGPLDGFLYIGLGDGGGSGDPFHNAQDPGTLLGKLLRIDVESGVVPYAIPPDNPFVGLPDHRPEIWVLGLRNPWRFSFDRQIGDLYIGDVGQERWEEVDFQPAASPGGENYGWPILEGSHCFQPRVGCVPPPGYSPPVAQYSHRKGCAIVGGFVYRGSEPSMQGIYFYADFCSGRIWGLRFDGTAWRRRELAHTPYQVSSFGEDEAGELYLADYSGSLYRVDARSPLARWRSWPPKTAS